MNQQKEKARIPLTSLKGLILPGRYDCDGYIWGNIHKKRLKHLFSFGNSNLSFGLNCYYWNDGKRSPKDTYKAKVLSLINQYYLGYFRILFCEDGTTIEKVPLGENNWQMDLYDDWFGMVHFENEQGDYIGDPEWALDLIRRGIYEPLAIDRGETCCYGFCDREQKWYGWSHRAIYGFGVGSQVRRGGIAYKPANAEDMAASMIDFWRDEARKESLKWEETTHEGEKGILLTWEYKDDVPVTDSRGGCFEPYPDRWGKGSWVARNLEDAKQMAIDFAENVS